MEEPVTPDPQTEPAKPQSPQSPQSPCAKCAAPVAALRTPRPATPADPAATNRLQGLRPTHNRPRTQARSRSRAALPDRAEIAVQTATHRRATPATTAQAR